MLKLVYIFEHQNAFLMNLEPTGINSQNDNSIPIGDLSIKCPHLVNSCYNTEFFFTYEGK